MSDGNKVYKVKANEFLFSFTKAEIDGIDLLQLSPAQFNLIKDHRSVNGKMVETDATGKKLKIETEGEIVDIEIKDELDQVLDQMGFGSGSSKQIKEIKAPMPGLVLEIAVVDGQDIKEGDKILILEAMKMENCIIIQTNARIKKIVVAAGQAVEKGQVLVELE